MRSGTALALAFVVSAPAAAGVAACGSGSTTAGRLGAPATSSLGATAAPAAPAHGPGTPAPGEPLARLPVPPGSMGPSFVSVDAPGGGAAAVTGTLLADVDTCAECHPDVVATWRRSAHAFASFNNPIYRLSVERFRREVGKAPSRFCGGCHDVALLVDGAMEADVAPDDPRAHAGVTCRMCHGIARVTPDGNGSYVLTAADIPLPKKGDAESVKRHVARVALSPLRTAELCAACHRAFLDESTGNPHHLPGMDDASAWARSAYAGSRAALLDAPVAAKECRGCHMPLVPAPLGDEAATEGRVASHRVLGGHTWLAASLHDAAHSPADAAERTADLAAAVAALGGAATIDVAAAVAPDGTRTLPADGAPVAPGARLTFGVVVRNVGVGHRFPGGTLDAQDTWIELTVRDARGRLVAEAGTAYERDGADPTAHRLVAAVGDEHGTPLLLRETHLFRATVWDHTVAPRDAELAEFAFDAPAALAPADLPLRVTALLRHRSRGPALAAAACAESRTPRGRAFTAGSLRWSALAPDPCVPQPVTDLARADVFVGAGWEAAAAAAGAPASRPAWSRLYDHALALQHAVQERVHEAIPSLDRALALLEEAPLPAGDDRARAARDRERAMVLALLARTAAREGRSADAVAFLERAEPLAPGDPALARLHGDALAAVWRWKESVPWLRAAALASPRDDDAWAALATALGSAGDDAAALDAARRALASWPRHPDLLRVQALALEHLGAPPDLTAAALEAYLTCRRTDEAPGVRAACSKLVPGCALERVPVHVHVMRAAPRS